MSGIKFLHRARRRMAILAGTLLISLVTVAAIASIVGGLALLIESEQIWDQDYISINDCLIDDDGQTALTRFWTQPVHGPARLTEVGAHRLDDGRAPVQVYWPSIFTTCLAASSTDDRVFLGANDGAIYSATRGQPDAAPALIGRQTDVDIRCLEPAPDGRCLLSVGARDLCAWSVDPPGLRWRRGDITATCAAFDPDSQSIVCGLLNGEVVEIESSSGRTLRSITRLPYAVNTVRISPDGRWLACLGLDRRTWVFNWPAGTNVWNSRDSLNFAACGRLACFSPDSKYLVSAAVESVRNLVVWNVQTGQRLGELRGHEKVVVGARFTADGRLVSWGTDGTIRTWDVEQRRAIGVVSLLVPASSS